MKLHILNDLHIEFSPFDLPHTDTDVVVLAGDIGVGLEGLEWAAARFAETPIIYVPGNHEFYGEDITLLEKLKSRAPPNIHVLDDGQVECGGVRFLGCVLWSDFLLLGKVERDFCMKHAPFRINDFRKIRNGHRLFTPEDAVEWHTRNRNWLTNQLDDAFPGATVVVTHHAPSRRSIPRQFSKDPLSPAFASNLEDLMGTDRVALWIHGHLHGSSDYEVKGTRVVCNPRGYVPHEPNGNFQPNLIVEI